MKERKKHAGRKVGGRGGKRVISIYYTHVCNYQRANLVNKPVKFKKVKKKDAKVSMHSQLSIKSASIMKKSR